MANIKKKNKNDPNNKSKIKQTKIRESSYCETNCENKCKQYDDYMKRLKQGKILHGLKCNN
jgi:hypothetical protein